MMIRGQRALVAVKPEDLPTSPEQRDQLTADMWWLQYGEELPAVLLAEPPTGAVN